MTSNPQKAISIYDISSSLKEALPDALGPRNIPAGLKTTAIAAFNEDMFREENFLCSNLTDRPLYDE